MKPIFFILTSQKIIMLDKITRVFDCIQYQNNNFPQEKSLVYKEDDTWRSYSSQEFINIANKKAAIKIIVNVSIIFVITFLLKNLFTLNSTNFIKKLKFYEKMQIKILKKKYQIKKDDIQKLISNIVLELLL